MKYNLKNLDLSINIPVDETHTVNGCFKIDTLEIEIPVEEALANITATKEFLLSLPGLIREIKECLVEVDGIIQRNS